MALGTSNTVYGYWPIHVYHCKTVAVLNSAKRVLPTLPIWMNAYPLYFEQPSSFTICLEMETGK